jgi:phosphatidylserine/phosphatidylglycerophosphate/cardiolipin synthase-like enzyme
MKQSALILLLLSILPLHAQSGPQDLHAFFSPNGGCTDAVVSAIDQARKNVLVQAYSFTSAPIAQALVNAKRRGVDVQVILDKSQRSERYSGATYLANEGIPVSIDSDHRIAHNKVMIIDGQTVITGSFNFTKSAESGNAENVLLILHAPELASKYAENWKLHLAVRFQEVVHAKESWEDWVDEDPKHPTASNA